mgnify:CR=1 FL=1
MEQTHTEEQTSENNLTSMDSELGDEFTFTQYLYSEEDVRQAIATNILLKNKEKTNKP